MAENLAARVGRIVSGGLHAFVAAVENAAPEVVLDQAMREVDGAMDEVRAELGALLAKKHLASQRLMEENRRHEELVGRIELALAEGREDLAEAAIARQLDIEAQIPVLERTITECGEQEKELEGFVSALQAKKRQMRQELEEFTASRQAASHPTSDGEGGRPVGPSTAAGRAERAVSAFDEVMRRTWGVPAAAGDMKDGARLAELEDLSRRNRVQERLAAAKARLAEKS